ncbi:MAG: sensor histidine kinase [Candidatus Sumerlaeaceae bacterium]|jgi:signal transduction histidine kinase
MNWSAKRSELSSSVTGMLSLRRGLPSFAAMVVLIAILFLFNLSTMRLLHLFEASKENDLTRQLIAVGRAILYDLRKPTLPSIVELIAGANEDTAAEILDNFADTAAYTKLLESFGQYQRTNDLRGLTLLTPHGLVIVDSTRQSEPGSAYVFRDIDRAPLTRAVRGLIAAMPLYPIGDTYYKRVYLPVVSDGRVVAILALSASADYFESLRDIQRRVRFQMIFTSLLFGFLIYLLYRFLTYLLRAETRALHLARYEAMAALAGGLAHELRNPLSIMRILCEEIIAEQPPDSIAARNARELIGEIERLNELVTHFLSLSKPPDPSAAQTVAFDEEIRRACELLRKSTPQNISLRLDLPAAPVYVVADPRALRQIVLNLVLNAREALAERGGAILITLSERRGMAELHIRDSGPGIPPQLLSRVFDPFFTTKRSGSGLGLAITRSIVENLGGTIFIHSMEGKGTDVCVRLPLAERPPRRNVTNEQHNKIT